MTALDPASATGPGGLAALAGLEMAAGQLAPLLMVLRAEQARRTADITVSRPAWKNLLADAENGHAAGNARFAVQLLTQATTNQAHRITASPQPCDPAALAAICAADIPDSMPIPAPTAPDQHPGQYLWPFGQSRRRLWHPQEAPAVESLCVSGLGHREPAPKPD